jgi:four helix bundle protein
LTNADLQTSRMTAEEMKQRTKAYALRVIRLVQALPRNEVARTVGGQLLRSGTSVGANYRSACRAKSRPDFVHKLKIVEEECDESLYWMELLVEGELIPAGRLQALQQEGSEILSIVVASLRTTRLRAA